MSQPSGKGRSAPGGNRTHVTRLKRPVDEPTIGPEHGDPQRIAFFIVNYSVVSGDARSRTELAEAPDLQSSPSP